RRAPRWSRRDATGLAPRLPGTQTRPRPALHCSLGARPSRHRLGIARRCPQQRPASATAQQRDPPPSCQPRACLGQHSRFQVLPSERRRDADLTALDPGQLLLEATRPRLLGSYLVTLTLPPLRLGLLER